MNDPRDLPLEDRLRAHFADRAAREAVPPAGAPPTAPASPGVPPWWRRPTLLVAAAGLLVLTGVATAVAVTGGDDEQVGSGGSDETTTTSEQEATTSTAVPTTTSSTTTTSTTSTTAPQPTGVTVVVAPDGVLGWWDGTAWVRGDSGAAPPIAGGESYRLIQLGGRGTATGSAPQPGCEFAEVRPTLVDLGIERPADHLAPPAIGLLGVDEPHPRPVTELVDPAAYEAVADELRAAHGLRTDGSSVRVVRADLGGNGTDEVLLSVERLSDRATLFAAEGDYSLLVLRQVIDEQVHEDLLHSSIAEVGDGLTPFVEVARTAAVADLNGDGRMEVVVQYRYYEGSATEVFESDPDGGVHSILSVGCGV